MDKLDLQILYELARDAQTSFSKIAKKIGLSPKTVLLRFNKLKKEGIIVDSTIIVDLLKLGYQGRVFLNIVNKVDRERKETINALKQTKNIFLISEIIGDFDVMAVGAVKNFKGLISLVKTVSQLPSVLEVKFTLADDAPFPFEHGFEEVFHRKEETS
jgi:DNA-binding Lrp family transcriptional regulator